MSAQKKGLGRGLSALFGEIENKTDNKVNQKNFDLFYYEALLKYRQKNYRLCLKTACDCCFHH